MSEGCPSPRITVYSVSFCDSPTDYFPISDKEPLLGASDDSSCADNENIIPDRAITIEIMGAWFSIRNRNEPIVVPTNHHGVVTTKSPRYGVEGDVFGTKRILYCVHGNSKDCCSVDTYVDESGTQKNNVTVSGFENEHCHNSEVPLTDKRARRKIIIASILCVVFMIAEGVGGYLSNSLAIASDAAHLLTDFASFMISLFSLWVASRPATRKMSFGWYRAEVIGALTSVMMIWVVTGILVYLAVERLINKSFEIDAQLMLITSAIGVVINLIMGLALHQHGHTHSSDSSHSHEENINVRAALIHVIGDFLQSFGVLVAALIIYFKPTWLIVDPICTFLFSILVIVTTYAIIRDTVNVLMEGIPKGVDFVAVTETFLSIEGVAKVHNLRIWALSLDKIALSAHLAIRPGVDPLKILTTASKSIKSKYNFFEMTLQIEEFQEKMDDCFQCKMPQK